MAKDESAADPEWIVSGKRWILRITLALAVFLGLVRAWESLRERSGFEVVVAFENLGDAQSGRWQIFYDRGSGFVEEDSVTEIRTVAAGESVLLSFEVPSFPLRGFRFDLPGGENELRFDSVEIFSEGGEFVRALDGSVWTGTYEIEVSEDERRDSIRIVSGKESVDPQIWVNWDQSEVVRPILIGIEEAVVEFVVTTGFLWFLFFFPAMLVFLHGRKIWAWVFSFRVGFPSIPGAETKRRLLVILLSGSVFVPLLLYLSWEDVTTPGLLVEDSHHYFNRYYDSGHGFLDAVRARPNGYYNVANNAYAWAVSQIDDVRWQPAFYNAAAVAVFIVASILPAFTPLVRNRFILAVVAPVLGLAGMNHVFYLTTLTFQMYVVILILIALLFLGPPRTKVGLGVHCLAGVLLVFSGPYSVVVVPVSLLMLLLFRDFHKQVLWCVLLVAGIVYNRMTPGMARLDNLFDPEIVLKMITVTFEQVFFLDFGGDLQPWKIGVFLLVSSPAVVVLSRDPQRMRMCLVLLALVLLALTPLFLSRKFFFYSDPAPCHVLISRFFWIFLILYGLDGLVQRLPRMLRTGAALSVVATMVFFIWADTQIRPWKFHYPRVRSVAAFMEKIREAESLGLKERDQYMMLALDGNPVNPFGPRVRVGSQSSTAVRVPAIE